MKKMTLAIFGLGPRARYLASLYEKHPYVEIVAICDRFERNVAFARELLQNKNVHSYLSYENLIKNEHPDAMLIAIDPDRQVAYACDAMERGIHVMTEVPAAFTLEDCWKLVDTVEKTGAMYQLNEQTRYMYFISKWREMFQKGEMGKILLMEGEYLHYERWDNFVDMNTGNFFYDPEGLQKPGFNGEEYNSAKEKCLVPSWRYTCFKHPIYYLPHELSPLLSITEDRVTKVSCMGTRPQSYHDGSVQKDNRDMEVALMHTANDTLLRMVAGFTSPHPHRKDSGCHWYHVSGTKAEVEWSRTEKDFPKMWTAEKGWAEGDLWPFSDPEADELAKSASHGGLDFYPIDSFVKAFFAGKWPPMNVYRAVETAAPAIIAARSSELGGVLLDVPDFRAKYNRYDI
ncbi:MAG: Gfo/Idh/MocA family oxidoreductase [Eubacteriales bacterium]|nr:Gfo/Idh/MocA family oxidoreductase [Eubacteriales bacterium]